MSPIAQWLIDTYGAQMACRILGRPMRTAAPCKGNGKSADDIFTLP